MPMTGSTSTHPACTPWPRRTTRTPRETDPGKIGGMKFPLATTPALRALCFFAFAFTAAFIWFHDPPEESQMFWDKAIHFVVYGGMAFMLWLALGKRWALAAFFAVWAVGAGDEILQHFTPGRTADVWDFATDGLGAGFCLLVARRVFT